jgi:multiple sugar transport system substrate-binding protein
LPSRDHIVRVALVGGPMYDPLYEAIPTFERESALRVEVVARLPHPELNAFVKDAFISGGADLDLISTHTKYAPSQAEWLSDIEGDVPADVVADLLPRPAELSRIGGRLLQVPRNLDVRLLHVRTDVFEDAAPPLEVPGTWIELAETASLLTRDGFYGFLFPGRDSGLFGTFYEMLVSAGGDLFDEGLRPAFHSDAGEWAAGLIADLHRTRRVTPGDLASWHYDEISASFRSGHAAMVCDWPGSYHLYGDRRTCVAAGSIGLALLPAGPAGVRAAYAGCHSFALPRASANRAGGAALLLFLTSSASQLGEARRGAIPCRASALSQVRREAAADPPAARRWALLAETERFMIMPPRFASYPLCEDAIWHAVQRAMEGAWPPAVALRRAAGYIQTIVDAHVPAR